MSVSSSVAGTGVLTKGIVAPGYKGAKGDDPSGSDFAALMRSGKDGGKSPSPAAAPLGRHGEMREPEQTSDTDNDAQITSNTSSEDAEPTVAMRAATDLQRGAVAKPGQAGASGAFTPMPDQPESFAGKGQLQRPHLRMEKSAAEPPEAGLAFHQNGRAVVDGAGTERQISAEKTRSHAVSDVPAREVSADHEAGDIRPGHGKSLRRDSGAIGQKRDTANDPDAVADDADSDSVKADEAGAQYPAPVMVMAQVALPVIGGASDDEPSAARGIAARDVHAAKDAAAASKTKADADAAQQTRDGSRSVVVGKPQSPAVEVTPGAPAEAKSTQEPASASAAARAPVPREAAQPPPPAFRTELTMAAANYALQASKTQTAQSEGARIQSPDAGASDGSEPVRISMLGPREPMMQAPVIITNQLAMPVPLSASVGGEVPVKAAALAAGTLGAKDVGGAFKPQRQTDPDAPAPSARSSAADQSASPAPTQAMTAATATVVSAIASEPSWRPAPVAAAPHLAKSTGDTQVKTLSIQLHPAELGVVTATLRLVGDQLTVELSADTEDARTRLSSDSHTIAKSLRALGFDVDQVTILQAPVTNAAPSRSDDTTAFAAPTPRDQQAFSGGAAGGSGGRLGGQQTGRNGDDTAHGPRNAGSPAADGGNGGLYI